MKVILYYKFESKDESVLNKVSDFFSSIGMEPETEPGYVCAEKESIYFDEEPVETHFLRIAAGDCKKLYELLGTDLVLFGVIDTSYTAGEYMDFCFEYKNGTLSGKYSDWYTMAGLDEFESYEEMCEEMGEVCTEEEFERYRDIEAYFLEKASGDVLSYTVPLVYIYKE